MCGGGENREILVGVGKGRGEKRYILIGVWRWWGHGERVGSGQKRQILVGVEGGVHGTEGGEETD